MPRFTMQQYVDYLKSPYSNGKNVIIKSERAKNKKLFKKWHKAFVLVSIVLIATLAYF